MDRAVVPRPTNVEALLEGEASLEECLHDLARLAADRTGAERCSVMLIGTEEGARQLTVRFHWDGLPAEAYDEAVALDSSIAGHVIKRACPLLIRDLARSPLAHLARSGQPVQPSLICAPIRVGGTVLGAINASGPRGRDTFDERDLDLLDVFALFVGKSIQAFHLRKLAESRLLQMAQCLEGRLADSAPTPPICPDPGRLAKLVAKSFYRELAAAGFGPGDIIAVSSQVLGELNDHLARYRAHAERHKAAR